MPHQPQAEATSGLYEPVSAAADETAGPEGAEVVYLDDRRRRLSPQTLATPRPLALAQARAAHPAQLWADSRAALPS